LNVFPVPDGDTGMNMNLTLTSGVKEIQGRNDQGADAISAAWSSGLLMGSRGNSGVITSQIFKGFALGCKGKDSLDPLAFAEALASGKEVAYKAVMRPVEGTILTVIRESSSALLEWVHKTKDPSIESTLEAFLNMAKKSLAHTPDLLPVLKEVGVVDSGGAGLCVVIEGMLLAAKGEFVERNENIGEDESSSVLASPYAGALIAEGEESYGYCTQFLLRVGSPDEGKRPWNEKKFTNFVNAHGNSVVIVSDGDIVKVHVHTLRPGAMLNYAQNYGEFLSVTIENMSEEHHNIEHGDVATDMDANIRRGREETPKADAPLAEYGIIAVSSGEGLDEMFKELGASVIVSGGQTMNPSTEDFVKAIDKAHAKHILILPNNGNIYLSAKQACDLMPEEEGKTYAVVSAKSIPQGLGALLQFSDDLSPEEALESMNEGASSVIPGSVTYAIKDTDIEGVHIVKGHYMAMRADKDIVACLESEEDALFALLDDLAKEGDKSMFTVLLGKDVKKEEEEKLSSLLPEKYPDFEFLVKRGDQAVYSFLVGLE